MERPSGTGHPGTTSKNKTHPDIAQQPDFMSALEPARTPSALAPALPACHIRPQQWSPRTSAASKYEPFVFIKRKYKSEDEESGEDDAPDHVPAAVATTSGPSEVPGAGEVGGGRPERVARPPLITYKRRSKMQAATTGGPQRFKSLGTILKETVPGDQ